jgi:sphingosine kinase
MAGNTTDNGDADVPATLAVGRNASLTLGTDALIVLGTYSWPGPRCAH